MRVTVGLRRLTAVLGAAAVLVTAAPASAVSTTPPGPGTASGFFTFGGGRGLEGTRAIADFPAGYNVYVLAGTPHATELATGIRYAVGQLRRYGIGVTYRGFAADVDSARGTGSAEGKITVTEASTTSAAACTGFHYDRVGVVAEAATRPSFQDLGGVERVNDAAITFCPPIWSHPQDYVTAIALHEMGHAVGLGHYPGRFVGQEQVMNPVVPLARTYRAGDVNGLRYLAYQTTLLRSESALNGRVESWRVSRKGLRVDGWALTGRTDQFTDVAVTRDGAEVYATTSSVPRPDVSRRYDALWQDPGFASAWVPMARGRHTYCVLAIDPSVQTTRKTLGCRSLVYPPPGSKPLPPPPTAASPTHGGEALPAVVGAVALLLALGAGWILRRRRLARGGLRSRV